MQLTETQHKRFWKTMQERYGQRWTNDYGEIPTKPWRDLLDQHTPKQIAEAIRALATECPLHPPTQPQFQKLLGRSVHGASELTDWTRGYWRSCVISNFERELIYRELVKSPADAEQYLIAHQREMAPGLRNLLDELCDMDQANKAERTDGMYERCAMTVRDIVQRHIPGRAA